ncbi:MAG: ABC-F family ATP-binding cassette domain-containing protein [Anaerolineales bacterium]
MHVINLDHVAVNFGGRVIFSDLSWAVGDRARVGLVGRNGTGKSSLLKLIARELAPDEGSVAWMREVSVAYLPQEVSLPPGQTLIDTALALPEELARIENQLARIQSQLADPTIHGDAGRLARALERQEQALATYVRLGGPGHASNVREILAFFGFTPADYDLPTEAFSGGQKKLAALVRLAAEARPVLLLDEPDNHLDMAAKRRLEEFIVKYKGAVIIVSHDRYLLDEVADEIVEMEDGQLKVYPGNYSAYVAERELRRLRQQQLHIAQQKEISRIEASIARFEMWAGMVVKERHIRQARSRRRMLDRMEARGEIIEPVREAREMRLQLEGWRGSTNVLEVQHLSMGFGSDLLLQQVNFLIRHGERVGMIGPNGSGKSVLFKLILGELVALGGTIVIGPSIKVGYYAQEHETLEPWLDRTPMELVRHVSPRSEGDAVAYLVKFLFTYQQVTGPIRNLSGGERSRLQLSSLILGRPNLLLLDEPTNNLDIPSAEVLEAALDDFEGTILSISHDRYFLDRVVDRLLVLEGGLLRAFEGGYTDMLAQSDA